MAKCYYSYSFDLEDGLVMDEVLYENMLSPMQAAGCEAPLDFDDYVDIWKSLCFPIFGCEEDERKLTTRYFREAYERGENSIIIELEHNPLKNTYADKYTRVNILLAKDEETGRPRATVQWEDLPN